MNYSNKASRAENQQERLIKIGWVVGFVDGEGNTILLESSETKRRSSRFLK